ncbi:MAG: hypothetical protein IJX76_07115 [Clostridia bacterium]|nr:hypothetical protein [Clostridia bacterium]
MPGPSNVYKPKMAGFLIAAIALVMVVILILISTILIVASGGESGATTTVTDPNKPGYTTPVQSGNNTPGVTTPSVNPGTTTVPNPGNTTVPVNPGTDPEIDPSDVTTLELPVSKVGEGALILIDKSHFYTKEGLVARKDMNSTTAGLLGFEWVRASEYYKIPNNSLYLDAATLEAFNDMMADLYEVTGTGIVQIRNAYYYSADLTAITDQDSLESVEHSTGCVVDLEINNNGISPLTSNQYKEKYYTWFVENCWKYGFVHLRDTTKYSSFRYVGIAHAAALHKDAAQSFETYFGTYLTSLTAFNFDNKKKVVDNEGNEWWIYYVKAETGADTVYVPVLGDPDHYQISGDNKGGFIVAVNSAQFAK